MKAIKITTNNVISIIDIPEQSLWGMQEHVGGPIETVRPFGLSLLDVPGDKNLLMIVNEEGRCIGLDMNKAGSSLYNDGINYPFTGFEPIVGDILFMAEGFVDGEPDIVGLEDDQIIALFQELKSRYSFLKEKKCRVCGCTDICACSGGCYWVEDDLCSACANDEKWNDEKDFDSWAQGYLKEEENNEME